MKEEYSMSIDVLDHGFVRLVSHMQPTYEPTYADSGWTGDLEIVRNARVSYNADWRTGQEEANDERLLRRLVTHDHTSPLEAMVFTFEVKAPIFVLRQWHRHRTWSYNEISARYTKLDEGFYVPNPEHIGAQDDHEKQARNFLLHDSHQEAAEAMRVACAQAFETYQLLLNRGVPRELARTVLPLAAYSRMFATVDLHNLLHFLRLRLDKHAQYEIRVYAEAILKLIEPLVPVTLREWRASRD